LPLKYPSGWMFGDFGVRIVEAFLGNAPADGNVVVVVWGGAAALLLTLPPPSVLLLSQFASALLVM